MILNVTPILIMNDNQCYWVTLTLVILMSCIITDNALRLIILMSYTNTDNDIQLH